MRRYRHAWLLPLVCLLLLPAAPGTSSAGELPVKQVVIDKSPPERPYTKMAADFDGDGLVDIAIAGARGPMVWYQAPAWRKRLIATGGYNTVDGEPADIDGDGDLDIVVGGLVWFENPGRSALATAKQWTAHRVAKVPTHDVEVGDLDDDGKLDIVTRNQSSFSNPSGDRFYIWKQQDGGQWASLEIKCPHGEGIKLADLDADGDPDIVIGALWYENTVDIVGRPWPKHVYAQSWKHPDAEIQCGDLNGDGRLDIVLTPSELKGDTYRISWFEGPSDPQGLWQEHVIENKQETVVHALGVADMNRDGSLDVVIAEMHQGADPDEVRVYLNRGTGEQWTRQVLATTGSHDIVLADIGGDGDSDIVGANHAGSVQDIFLWENLTRQ